MISVPESGAWRRCQLVIERVGFRLTLRHLHLGTYPNLNQELKQGLGTFVATHRHPVPLEVHAGDSVPPGQP